MNKYIVEEGEIMQIDPILLTPEDVVKELNCLLEQRDKLYSSNLRLTSQIASLQKENEHLKFEIDLLKVNKYKG